MRFSTALLALAAAACTRPPPEQPAPRGLLLEGVTLTTWRGAELSASGTAARATVTPQGFFAEGVSVKLAGGVSLTAPLLDGAMSLDRLAAADGVTVKTSDGCAGSTRGRVDYEGGVARTEGPVTGGGCGFSLDGARLVYSVAERRAEVLGPVRTRIEAAR